MRYGLLSDIHANVHALDAAIAVLEREGVDRFLCAGDLVGYGPFPNLCVERISALDCVTVAGNHDLAAVGSLPGATGTPSALDSMRWTESVLTEASRRFLAQLPAVAMEHPIVLAHGALGDPQRYVTTVVEAGAQLAAMQQVSTGSTTLVLGHTHHPWAYASGVGTLLARRPGTVELDPARPHLLNAGSVGQSRDTRPDARFAMLDLDSSEVTFYAEPYDVDACRAALRRLGRPVDSCHVPPSRRSQVRRHATEMTQRLFPRTSPRRSAP